MAKINVGRVLLGGLLAGVVLNIGEALLNAVVLAETTKQDFSKLGLSDPSANPMFLVRVVSMTFVLGIGIVYLYAAIRPRFGAGWKAAAGAGVMAWFFVYLYAGYIYLAAGIVSAKPYLLSLPWGIAEFALGAIAGAWLYKEE
ncbi:MAG TPA: hypothetical protein PLD20_06740 [Blastocatellia bacterium]|nr:hypothetical protein [Blastocatellia bacterium]HMV82950.1 hypothetical protein [Blastocatellia bacterium]HMX24635.1 hypothetical protein [Blastocatellia bacterium]HMY71964.1 hypothetical protein [Blastocatellia bacterium]HMZ17605.1 hypothetical protein [Blastocatellia bacterium]